MSRIEDVFKTLKIEGKKGLIPFITAGDPGPGTTLDMMHVLADTGATVIELGIPYSDPMADGPVIQAASERALERGIGVGDVLAIVKKFRETRETPVILFGYYNPIFQYGEERFAKDAAAAGADGCLVVDLPPEHAQNLVQCLRKNGLDWIALLTPTSDDDRISAVAQLASGFLYYVSVKGVTGADSRASHIGLQERILELKARIDLPVAVGFGIATRDDVEAVQATADAAVVGTALIQAARPWDGDSSEICGRVADYFGGLLRTA